MIVGGTDRYLALGDSFTEGVGDDKKHWPNGVKGWADWVAEGLARDAPGWEYANLAVRSKRLRHVAAEQLEAAMDPKPTLVTLYAGGNDVMDVGTSMARILQEYESLVARLAQSGAAPLLFTGYDVEVSPPLAPLRSKNHAYNDGIRTIAAKYGATVVDYASWTAYENPAMWCSDRLHMSKRGHKYLAGRVLDLLEVPHGISLKDKSHPPTTWKQRGYGHYRWYMEWVVPLIGRKMRRTTLGDSLGPRWPEPVRVPPKKGLRKLVRASLQATR
ncbi:SGNH/GDSL hydrolase family protein [Arthrobacter psychrochitiniphilus]|uniref:Lipase n=1 Tax=Arthrobacter psychrochitiniphilus TaxID=291045 RepID=A0A2V3DQ70_9MICC|nr:SGNH/GDSL hydrolase family protein [Arthrobacter psychrochitiniphilus]NYG17804.1 lysophospholipase L1-like esterase [Arthrobacter psychrochitiniphilus]PXA65152.1 lipase [Arthrobacter psychrochitiniphilus]